MEEGVIHSLSVKEGDLVSKGDVLGEIEIEKLTNELLAEEDGVVLKIVAEEGETLPCGAPILFLGAAGESLDPGAEPPAAVEETAAESALVETSTHSNGPGAVSPPELGEYLESAQITPKGLQLAQELGVDYHFIKGTGRMGMVTREDIRQAVAAGTAPRLEAAARPSLQSETVKMSQMQLAVARAMDASLKSTAQTTISMDLDAGPMVAAYRAHKEEYSRKDIKLTYTAILIKIVAEALVEHRLLRTTIEGSNLVTRAEINVGIAIDIDDGLVVPNIKNASQKSIAQIAVELAGLGKRAKENALSLDDITAGVFTITNLGMFGIKYFAPILNPGESGILGVGTIQEVAVVQQGGIFMKPVLNLSLTHDHRVVNGAPAARFLQSIQRIMNDCESLF
jgi:pyruvate dehydrogenase E2 component (dihydrolipoamide acetyltransferase)